MKPNRRQRRAAEQTAYVEAQKVTHIGIVAKNETWRPWEGGIKQSISNGSWKRGERAIAYGLLCVNVVTLLVLIYYAHETHRQAESAAGIITVTQKQFTKEQRPYVWITKPRFDDHLVNEELHGSVILKNFGRSPAMNVRGDVKSIFVGPKAEEKAYKFLDLADSVTYVYKGPQSIFLPPNDPQDPQTSITIPLESYAIRDIDVSWASTHQTNVMGGLIQYSDSAGNNYETMYCVEEHNSTTDGSGPCPTHNLLK